MRHRWRVFVEDLLDHIDRTLAARPYFPCVLLVHTDVRRVESEGERLALAQRRPGPILCSDLALLFEPLLALDPLALLRQWSRSLPVVLNTRLQQAATSFAGRYKVVRMELGAVTRRLYYIITDQLSAFLQSEGIDYQFPRLDEVGENKSSLLQAMHPFNTKYPDHGLLLVVDELLDYLRAQDAAGLNLDFGYLRELGEVTELAPFRFIVGIQESLFDSPSFALGSS